MKDVDVTCRSNWIPILFPQRTHSVVFTCNWQIGSFLERVASLQVEASTLIHTAKLFVVAFPMEDELEEELSKSFEDGTVVYESPVAPDEEKPFTFSFSCNPALSYYLYYHVTSGGNSPRSAPQLRIENLVMHAIIHDCAGQWLFQHFRILGRKGFHHLSRNQFALNMLCTLAGLAQQDMTPENLSWLTALLPPSDGFDTCAPSMKALEEFAIAMAKVSNKANAYIDWHSEKLFETSKWM